MSNLMPILQMLGLPDTSGVEQVVDRIRELQRVTRMHQRRADDIGNTLAESQKRLRRAEDPDNWRVVFSGDETTSDVQTTALTHGNLISLEGTGQSLFYFHPCCQNLDCQCAYRHGPGGTCECAENDPIGYSLAEPRRCKLTGCNKRVPTRKRPESRNDRFCSDLCAQRHLGWVQGL
jgi:hypothetical protein